MAGKTNGKFTEIYSVQGEMKQSQPVLLTYTKYTGFWPVQHKLNQVKLILIAKIPLQDMIEKTHQKYSKFIRESFEISFKISGDFLPTVLPTQHSKNRFLNWKFQDFIGDIGIILNVLKNCSFSITKNWVEII